MLMEFKNGFIDGILKAQDAVIYLMDRSDVYYFLLWIPWNLFCIVLNTSWKINKFLKHE